MESIDRLSRDLVTKGTRKTPEEDDWYEIHSGGIRNNEMLNVPHLKKI